GDQRSITQFVQCIVNESLCQYCLEAAAYSMQHGDGTLAVATFGTYQEERPNCVLKTGAVTFRCFEFHRFDQQRCRVFCQGTQRLQYEITRLTNRIGCSHDIELAAQYLAGWLHRRVA